LYPTLCQRQKKTPRGFQTAFAVLPTVVGFENPTYEGGADTVRKQAF